MIRDNGLLFWATLYIWRNFWDKQPCVDLTFTLRYFPKTSRGNFFTRIIYSLYNFYGVTVTIKSSLYVRATLKWFSAEEKVQPKSVPKMAVF